MSSTPALSLDSIAADINREHLAAQMHWRSAAMRACAAGELLLQAKGQVGHGEWLPWLDSNCPSLSERTAQGYMRLAKHFLDHPDDAVGLQLLTLRAAFQALAKGRVRKSAPVADLPAANARQEPALAIQKVSEASPIEPEAPEGLDDVDEDAALAAAEQKLLEAAERAMGKDALSEIKRLTALVASLEITRDGYMRGKAEVTKMLKAEQRKSKRLERDKAIQAKEIERLLGQVEALQERIAIMEEHG